MSRLLLALILASVRVLAVDDIAFAGRDPGMARGEVKDGVLRLGNAVLAAEWRIDGGVLRPVKVTQGLSGRSVDQAGAEAFRLTTRPRADKEPAGVDITVSLLADRVVVSAGKEGYASAEIGSFPRSEFPGEPRLIRLGKMNLKAQALDHPGEAGPVGRSSVRLSAPAAAGKLAETFVMEAAANRAAVVEGAFPAGTGQLTARIVKGTDQGMSWGPAFALVWEDGVRFLLIGARDANGTLNLTTAKGEREVNPRLTEFPAGDLAASAFQVEGAPRFVALLPATGKVSRPADAIRGVALEVGLVHASGLRALWRAELRDGANHLRQTLELSAGSTVLPLRGVEMGELRLPGLSVVGSVPGCPVAGDGFFAGVEMPGAGSRVDAAGSRQALACDLQVGGANRFRFGSVLGVFADGQLRRGFLRYVERERARASQPFLHYNCWYDLGYGVDQPKMVDVVRAFQEELVRKRGVPVLSYLVDDGWDDVGKGLWADNLRRFPEGGLPGLRKAIGPFGGHLGVWISPLGGYGGAKERTEWARRMGLVPPAGQLDLSYPKYREWFAARCLQLMRESGVNAFKWDKAGEGVGPHFMALLDVARQLRKENPDLFVNVTVGTWPSPFWLNHVDTTWRNGSADVGWAGKGDDRERWLTFRDGQCRALFVERSPLYPLNSVMHHGIVHGRQFQGAQVGKAGPELRHEARSYFANGAMLQELYLTPSMMTAASWDAVAESAKWAHARADVLRDAHWVGGDPLKLEPYGYAAWSPRMGTLMVRNPDDKPREVELEAGAVFDLPAGAAGDFDLRSPYADQRLKSLSLSRGEPVKVTLEPFEVLVFDAIPKK